MPEIKQENSAPFSLYSRKYSLVLHQLIYTFTALLLILNVSKCPDFVEKKAGGWGGG